VKTRHKEGAMARKPASGIPAKGATKHAADCQCPRCIGFQPGNTLAERHGAYASPARLSVETYALAAELAPLVPAYSESDSVATELLALTLRRIARAEPAVVAAEDAGEIETSERLRREQRSWVNSATRLLDLLAMVPASRARLGLDVARARAEVEGLADAGRRIRLAAAGGEVADE
jgi:hypothetical protein